MCRSDDFTSTTSHFALFPSHFRRCFHCFVGFWNTRAIHGCGKCRNCKLLPHSLALLGPGGFLHFGVNVQNANVVSDGKRGRQRSAPNCAQMCWNRRSLQCHRTKLVHPETSPSRSQTHSSRDHTRFAPLISCACHSSHHGRRLQNASFEWKGIFAQHVKEIGMGVIDIAPVVTQSQ